MTHGKLPPQLSSKAAVLITPEEKLRRMTRRSFTVGAVGAALGLSGLAWLDFQDEEDGVPWALRRVLQFNEKVARAYFKSSRLAPTFPLQRASVPRENGSLGLTSPIDLDRWRLTAQGINGRALHLTLDDVKALPRVELVTELKCIEGWSTIVHWTGTRLADFAEKFRLATRSGAALDVENKPSDSAGYVSLETPDGQYYVGLDIESALHPQTLLCYEMDGAPLTLSHGAPLRLVTPLKYGIKHLKRIGAISFTDARPRDYWAKRGYDWYAGH
jgi:DMSO/TMAO reductase YedYZ molybdopterin-dependent catalytic subunit